MEKGSLDDKIHALMRRVPDWILSIVCLGVIFWLTLTPQPLGEEEPELFPGADKVAHGLMFFALTLCLNFDMLRHKDWHRLKLPMIAALSLLSMTIGIIIEVIQPEIGRGFEFWDMGADAFGAILAGTLWILIGGWLGTE